MAEITEKAMQIDSGFQASLDPSLTMLRNVVCPPAFCGGLNENGPHKLIGSGTI